MKPEREVLLAKPKIFSDFQEVPMKTRAGRKTKRPEKYG